LEILDRRDLVVWRGAVCFEILARLEFRSSAPSGCPNFGTEYSHWGSRFQTLAKRMGVSTATRMCTSELILSPLAFGVFKPMVLVPLAFLTTLPTGQVEAILLHELAHIRRRDYLVNLLQSLMETVFFFHPAVWWISRQMRIEREYRCDEIASTVCGVLEYTTALAARESLRSDSKFTLAPAATDGNLLTRIRRLAKPTTSGRSYGLCQFVVGSTATCLLVTLMFTAYFGTAENSVVADDIPVVGVEELEAKEQGAKEQRAKEEEEKEEEAKEEEAKEEEAKEKEAKEKEAKEKEAKEEEAKEKEAKEKEDAQLGVKPIRDPFGAIRDGKVVGKKGERKGQCQITVFGTVVDGVTGKLIEQGVAVQGGMLDPRSPGMEPGWGFSLKRGGRATGRFSTTINWSAGHRARVLVDGYEPVRVLTETPGPGVTRIEVTLRLPRSRTISGRVLDHEFEPVVGASVFAVPLYSINLGGGKSINLKGDEVKTLVAKKTDEHGYFRNLPLTSLMRVAVSTSHLDAWPTKVGEFDTDIVIRLPKPATFVLNYDIPGAPNEVEVGYRNISAVRMDAEQWKNVVPERVFTIKRGRTELKTLSPGFYLLSRRRTVQMKGVGRTIEMGSEYFYIEPGKTRTINWTRPAGGARVKVQLNWPKGTVVAGMYYSLEAEKPRQEVTWMMTRNIVDGGPIDLTNGQLQSAQLAPGKYKLNVRVQLPISNERQLNSSPIFPDYTKTIEVIVPEGKSEIVLPAMDLAIRNR
jgi:hypothetical protein